MGEPGNYRGWQRDYVSPQNRQELSTAPLRPYFTKPLTHGNDGNNHYLHAEFQPPNASYNVQRGTLTHCDGQASTGQVKTNIEYAGNYTMTVSNGGLSENSSCNVK